MGAAGFGTLASHFPDRTVVTYDPRGTRAQRAGRSDDPADARGARRRPASDHPGGRWRAGRPVRQQRWRRRTRWRSSRSIPRTSGRSSRTSRRFHRSSPTARRRWRRARAVHETYMRSGFGAGMAHFIAVVSHQGEFPDDFAQQPAPDPAMFGMPTEDDGSRTDPLLGPGPGRLDRHTSPTSTPCARPRRGSSWPRATRRARWPTAARTPSRSGWAPRSVIFPSGHGGFLGGEYGQTGEPDAFAAKLREVLAQA